MYFDHEKGIYTRYDVGPLLQPIMYIYATTNQDTSLPPYLT